MGQAMAKHISKTGWAELVGVVDKSATCLQKARDDWGLTPKQTLTDLGRAIDKLTPSIVMINTPSELHFSQAMRSLRSGCDTFIAKPVASNIKQSIRLADTADHFGKTCVVGQQMRFNRHYRAVQAFVKSGRIGSVESAQLLNSKPRHEALNLGTMPEPAMLEMACHHFDALLAILPGSRPVSITATGFTPSWSPYAGHCMVNAMIELEHGIHVLYHGGFSSQADCYELRLEGSLGTLRCRGIHMSATSFEYEVAARGESFLGVDIESEVSSDGAWAIYLGEWERYLRLGIEPMFSLRNNLPTFALLCAGMESIKRQRKIDLSSRPPYRECVYG
jgi:predicted dehydrogenase